MAKKQQLHIKWGHLVRILGLAVAAYLLSADPAVASTVYDVNTQFSSNTGTGIATIFASGTITTDGAAGFLNASDILGFNLTLEEIYNQGHGFIHDITATFQGPSSTVPVTLDPNLLFAASNGLSLIRPVTQGTLQLVFDDPSKGTYLGFSGSSTGLGVFGAVTTLPRVTGSDNSGIVATPDSTVVAPIPAPAWLFVSGLLSLVILRRKRKSPADAQRMVSLNRIAS